MKFYIKVEQFSIQGDHIHLLIRATRRSNYHSFFRVLSGQIAQVFKAEGLLNQSISTVSDKNKKSVTDTLISCDSSSSKDIKNKVKGTRLWKYRPFTRVVKSWFGLKTIRNYIQLNEQEARRFINYNQKRLRGLSSGEWDILWS